MSRRRLTSSSISFRFRVILGSESPTATTSPLESPRLAVVVDLDLSMELDVNLALDPDMVHIKLAVATEGVVQNCV